MSDTAFHCLPVQVHVKADAVEAFRAATLANARGSLQEPGVLRFAVFQDQDDPTRFVLVEVYRSAAAHAAHVLGGRAGRDGRPVSAPVTFEFATAGRSLFGSGVLAQVPLALASWKVGSALLVTGRAPGRAAAIAARLNEA